MEWIKRRDRINDKAESYPVYDNDAEAIADGVPEARIKGVGEFLSAGDWFRYTDGRIAQIRRINELEVGKGKIVRVTHIATTCLNRFRVTDKTVYSTVAHGSLFAPKKREFNYNNPNQRLVDFLEAWLFQGLELNDCVTKHLQPEYQHFLVNNLGWKPNEERTNRFSGYDQKRRKVFAYYVLSQPWLDITLTTNRVIRDKYMSFVGALKAAGVDDVYVATKMREALDSENVKERMAALSLAVDVITGAEAAKKPNLQINNQFNIGDEVKHKEIKEFTVPQKALPEGMPEEVDIDNILEGLKNGREQVARSLPESGASERSLDSEERGSYERVPSSGNRAVPA